MSAYVVDPRTVDYIVAWAERRSRRDSLTAHLDATAVATIPEALRQAVSLCVGFAGKYTQWRLTEVSAHHTGALLMAQNVRSVQNRYPDCIAKPDNMPGPCDQSRVFGYRYVMPCSPDMLKAEWVISCCDNLRYQSCETDDYQLTAAFLVMDAIRENAIRHLCTMANAPWGIDDTVIAAEAAKLAALRASIWADVSKGSKVAP